MALRLVLGTAVVAAGAAGLWALAAGSAAAKPGHVQLKLVQGGLSVASPLRTLTASRAATVTVVDARGTGAGWSLQVNAAQPLQVTRVAASCAAGSTCTLPRAQAVGVGKVVLRAARRSGMGVIRLTVTFRRPAHAVAAAIPVRFSISP